MLTTPNFEHWWQFVGLFHPLVVHFPIVFLSVLFIFDLLYLVLKKKEGLFYVRSIILYTAIFFTFPTVVTGFLASWYYPVEDVLISHHKTLGIFTFLVILGHGFVWFLTSEHKRSRYFFIFLALSLGSIILVSLTSEAGGIIVRETTPFQTKMEPKSRILTDSFLVKRYNAEKLGSYLRENITYVDVKNLFEHNGCVKCHSEQFSKPNLQGFYEGENKWLSTPLIESMFYKKIILQNTMPPKDFLRDHPGLSAGDRLILLEWLKNGAKIDLPPEEEELEE